VPKENPLDQGKNFIRENIYLEKWRAKGSKISFKHFSFHHSIFWQCFGPRL